MRPYTIGVERFASDGSCSRWMDGVEPTRVAHIRVANAAAFHAWAVLFFS